MATIEDRLDDISEIRSLMEQSSKFLSLSGLSGVSAGLVGLVAAVVAESATSSERISVGGISQGVFFLIEAIVTVVVALGCALFFSVRMARKKGVPIWTVGTRSLLVSLFVPLAAGGIYCLNLWSQGLVYEIAPAMLIFYGLALLNSSKYTPKEIRYLAYSELVLGLVAASWVRYGLILWGAGFGALHILYGFFMYLKYEK